MRCQVRPKHPVGSDSKEAGGLCYSTYGSYNPQGQPVVRLDTVSPHTASEMMVERTVLRRFFMRADTSSGRHPASSLLELLRSRAIPQNYHSVIVREACGQTNQAEVSSYISMPSREPTAALKVGYYRDAPTRAPVKPWLVGLLTAALLVVAVSSSVDPPPHTAAPQKKKRSRKRPNVRVAGEKPFGRDSAVMERITAHPKFWSNRSDTPPSPRCKTELPDLTTDCLRPYMHLASVV